MRILSLIFLMLLIAPVFAESIEFRNETNTITSIGPWQRVFVRVSNVTASSYIVKINSTSDPSGIVITVYPKNGYYEGSFIAYENQSNDVEDYLKASDNDIISAYADLDNNGTYAITTATFNTSLDTIYTYENREYTNNKTIFDYNQTTYIEVGAKKNIHSPMIIIESDKNVQNMSLTEVLPGLYRGSIKLDTITIGGNYVKIYADLNNDNISSEKYILVKDSIYTYKDSILTKPSDYFKRNEIIFIVIKSVLANNETIIDSRNITIKSSTSTKIVNVIETNVNSSTFIGNISINASGISVSTNDIVNIISNLTNLYASVKNVTIDNTPPTISYYTKLSYPKASVQRIVINVTDNTALNENATIYYWRPFSYEDYDKDGEIDIGEGAVINARDKNISTIKSFRFDIDCSDLETGYNVSYWIEISDLAGNNASGGNWSQPLHTFTIDATPPSIEIHEPYENQVITDEFEINVTVNDSLSGINISSIKYMIYENGIKIVDEHLTCTTYNCVHLINISNLSFGYLLLKVSVRDMAGNLRTEDKTIYHKQLIEKYIDFDFIAKNITLVNEEKKNYSIEIINKGNLNLENPKILLKNINYSLLEIPDVITTKANISLLIFDFKIGKKVVNIVVNISNKIITKNITIKILPNEKERQEIYNKFVNATNQVKILESKMKYDEISLSLLKKIKNELKLINKSISSDYYYAYFSIDDLLKNINALELTLERYEKDFEIQQWMWIVILLIIFILIYLFWPVRT